MVLPRVRVVIRFRIPALPGGWIGRTALGLALATGAATVVAAAFVARETERQIRAFETYAPRSPSRVYARPIAVELGQPLNRRRLVRALEVLDYGRAEEDSPRTSTYRPTSRGISLHRRSSPLPDGRTLSPAVVSIEWSGANVVGLRLDGQPVERAILDVPLLATRYDAEMRECRPIELRSLPPHVVLAFLAAEDDGFVAHPGVSIPSIVRAAWVNVRRGGLRQGGSTITQQLVKNLLLNRERTLSRKAREAMLALYLERRFSKRRILEAYLNEIYLGRRDEANLVGVGAAARAYFGKEPGELTLAEAATLAGMVAAPGSFDPLRHIAECTRRRDWVLDRMSEKGWAEALDVARAKERAIEVHPSRLSRRAPHFVDAVLAEARERYGLTSIDGAGHRLFTSLDWLDQMDAEGSVRDGLTALETQRPRRRREPPLEAALVSLDPRTGAVRAWVGGRNYDQSQFDRARQARRQLGSVFKPVVYAAAIASDVARPYDLVEDAPLLVQRGAERWEPRNDDRRFRGVVTVREALESSLNLPTVRVALATGLGRVRNLALELGLAAATDANPSLALGAVEASVTEVASLYATLARSGTTVPVHGLETVVGPKGRVFAAQPSPPPRAVLRPEVAFEVTAMLRGVVDHGTGHGARRLGLADEVAGKTGTSSERRDCWFAGYTPDRVTVVWVGHDDASPTRLSGSAGALPIWTRFTLAARPTDGYPAFDAPPSIREAWIDPQSGQLATERCPDRVLETLPMGEVPAVSCGLHDGTSEDRPSIRAGDPSLLTAELQTVTLGFGDAPPTDAALVLRPRSTQVFTGPEPGPEAQVRTSACVNGRPVWRGRRAGTPDCSRRNDAPRLR